GMLRGRGRGVIGVQTPEFGYEKLTRNVQTAIGRFGITYPVAQDNQYTTWKAFDNEYWPAPYLIDRNGHVVLKHVGEGGYDETERAIEAPPGPQAPVRGRRLIGAWSWC